jgi:hypothetical protein
LIAASADLASFTVGISTVRVVVAFAAAVVAVGGRHVSFDCVRRSTGGLVLYCLMVKTGLGRMFDC